MLSLVAKLSMMNMSRKFTNRNKLLNIYALSVERASNDVTNISNTINAVAYHHKKTRQ